jgi:tryptophan halogenase
MKLRRVAVIGHGEAPAMAATALRRAFGGGGLEVEWIQTPGEIPANRVLAALPNLQAFHRLLGLDTTALLRATRGSYALGQQYVGFVGGESEFLHGYGPVGRPIAGLPFIQFWLKARAAGLPANLADFSREAVAARNGRIRIGDGQGMRATAHGYHFDARRYAAALCGHARDQGVTITPDPALVPVAEGGLIAALRLSDGREIRADLFVDTTPGATILSALGDGEPRDAAVSGCSRLLLGSSRALRPLPLYSRVAAHRAGWSALYPLQDRTGIVIAYDGALMSDEEAAALAPLPLADKPQVLPLAPFQRRRPWIGNVVAIGDAAGQAEPLSATALHRPQIAITHIVSLFPVRADAMPEAGIYNEELAAWHARLRDFDAVPYALNRRTGEPFWDAARARPVSAELDARIALFGARGMGAQYNQDSFVDDEWQACFVGLGLNPRAWDPQVDRVDEQLAMADFRDQLAAIRADIARMEAHEAALARATAR